VKNAFSYISININDFSGISVRPVEHVGGIPPVFRNRLELIYKADFYITFVRNARYEALCCRWQMHLLMKRKFP